MVTIEEIYKKCGGIFSIAARFGYKSTQGVHYWKERGVPNHLHIMVSKTTGIPKEQIEEFTLERRKARNEKRLKKLKKR